MAKRPYHHGDLRDAVLAAAAEQIATSGVASISLRELARQAGVSHAAPAHHFGDRRGLLTELAIEGFELLADELQQAAPDFAEVAVGYVRFALRRPGHFAVMFRADLLNADDPRLAAARVRSGETLRAGVAEQVPDERPLHRQAAQLAAWSLVHGFSSLWLEGALENSPLVSEPDPEALARRMISAVHLT